MAVYFIQDEGGEVKIGFSDGNPHRRLNAFRTGNPRELKLLVSIPGDKAAEQALHARFADLRTRGEWFRPDPRLLGFIEAMQHVYRREQPKPTNDLDEVIDLFGVTVTQLSALVGAAWGWSVVRSSKRALEEFGGQSILDGAALSRIGDLTSDLEWVIACRETDPRCAGAAVIVDNWGDYLLAALDDLIDRHNSSLAEASIVRDHVECSCPVNEEYLPDDLGPLGDGPDDARVH